jgi:hypothetical protein
VGVGEGVGVGVGDGVGVGVGDTVPTLMEMLCLKRTPTLSFACTVRRCVPCDIGIEAFRVPPLCVTSALPSTYAWINETEWLSVVPATTVTGEATVALFPGVQMVTDGEAELSWHELPALVR